METAVQCPSAGQHKRCLEEAVDLCGSLNFLHPGRAEVRDAHGNPVQ